MMEKAKAYARSFLSQDPTGHDYYHTLRVFKTALTIAREECLEYPVDLETVGLMALLHDLDDRKLSPETHENLTRVRIFLSDNHIPPKQAERILEGIRNLSFAGTGSTVPASLEGRCVQDADRLDAIGAIGIARTFAFGGNRNRMIYDPDGFCDGQGHSIHHFYEKLLLLKEKMNTAAGAKLARQRHEYMEAFLEQFYGEWEGAR